MIKGQFLVKLARNLTISEENSHIFLENCKNFAPPTPRVLKILSQSFSYFRQTAAEWQLVFWITAFVYAFGVVFFALTVSGDRQPWNDPEGEGKNTDTIESGDDPARSISPDPTSDAKLTDVRKLSSPSTEDKKAESAKQSPQADKKSGSSSPKDGSSSPKDGTASPKDGSASPKDEPTNQQEDETKKE